MRGITTMHNSNIVLGAAKLSAYSLIFASCGFAAAFAWKIGSQHSFILGVVTVLFAVALDCIKPLSIGAAFQAFAASSIVRGILLIVLGCVAVLYSLSAEISLIATNRTDIVAERSNSS